MKFDRITVDPAVCGGKPCVRGLRFPVSRLLGLLAAGETREGILKAYPYLEAADIDEALRYAGGSLNGQLTLRVETMQSIASNSAMFPPPLWGRAREAGIAEHWR